MSFYPIMTSGPAQPIRVFFAQIADPTNGATGLSLADIEVEWCDVGASSFTGIDVGDGSDWDELGHGWYEFTLDGTLYATNPGVMLLHFIPDGVALESDIRCFVGAAASSGRMAARVEDISAAQLLAIADQVHDEDLSGHLGTNTLGTRIDATVSSRLAPTTPGNTLDVTATGEAGIDWANIGSPTTAVNLSGTSTKALEPLVAGRTLSVSTTNAVVVGSIENNKITAAAIATDAIGAAQLAADAVTEIQSGLATASALATVDDFVDTEVSAILSDTTTLLGRLSAARAGYLDNLNVGGLVASAASIAGLASTVVAGIFATTLRTGASVLGHLRAMDAMFFGEATGLPTPDSPTGTATFKGADGTTEIFGDYDMAAGTRAEVDRTGAES